MNRTTGPHLVHRPAARGRRAAASIALLAGLVLAGVLMSPGTGWAADTVTATSPTDGAVLATPPTEVTLSFSARPDPGYSHVSVTDPAGSRIRTGKLAAAGADGLGLRVGLPAPITGRGDFTVAYHVEFADGGDLLGVVRFSVGTGVAPAALSDHALRDAKARALTGHQHGVDPFGASLLVIDACVLVGVVLLLMRRPGARRSLEVLRSAEPARGPEP